MDFLFLSMAVAAGLFVWGFVGSMVSGFLPASMQPNAAGIGKYVSLLVQGVVVAAVIVGVAHLHGRIGRAVKAAV